LKKTQILKDSPTFARGEQKVSGNDQRWRSASNERVQPGKQVPTVAV